jgi:hypothetical protein
MTMEQQTTPRAQEVHSIHPEQARDDGTPARFDIYIRIHKALRALMADVLLRAGRMDTDDPRSLNETLAAVRGLLDVCRMHLEKENRYVHPAMEERRPGSTHDVAADHMEHQQACSRLEADIQRVETATPLQRAAAATRLYRNLALFVGENLIHMDVEETEHNSILWETHTDGEILAIEQAIIGSSTPEQTRMVLRWMVPHLTPAERAAMFTGMRRAAPAPVVDGALAAVKPHLDAPDWHKLMTALST